MRFFLSIEVGRKNLKFNILAINEEFLDFLLILKKKRFFDTIKERNSPSGGGSNEILVNIRYAKN